MQLVILFWWALLFLDCLVQSYRKGRLYLNLPFTLLEVSKSLTKFAAGIKHKPACHFYLTYVGYCFKKSYNILVWLKN